MIELILAAGIAAFLLFYFASSINEKEHFGLRLLLFSFGIIILIFVGKGAIDSTQNCENVLNNTQETLMYGYNYTGYHWDGYGGNQSKDDTINLFHKNITYTYSVVCYDKTTSTSDKSLYKILVWIYVLYSAYIVFYFCYWLFNLTMKFIRSRR